MKHLIVVVFATIICGYHAVNQDFVDKFMEKMQVLGEKCAKETNASEDDIAAFVDGDVPPTHEGKCMIFCLQKNLNMMKEDGTIDKIGSILMLDDLKAVDLEVWKKVLSVFIACGENAKLHDDPCETATELSICGRKQAKALGLDDSVLG